MMSTWRIPYNSSSLPDEPKARSLKMSACRIHTKNPQIQNTSEMDWVDDFMEAFHGVPEG
jgi:hypothetical protein